MRFNPLFFLGNRSGLTHQHQRIVDMRIPYVSWFMKQVGSAIWFTLAYAGIPIPVKVTMFIGKPIKVAKSASVDEVAEQSRLALQSMIREKQPYGHEYLPGLQERVAHFKRE